MMVRALESAVEQAGRLSAWILLALVGLILYDALMRYLFAEGSIALQELEWHLFDLVMLLSVAYTLKYNRHVRVDIFYHSFSPEVKRKIDLAGYLLLVLPFAALVTYMALDFVAMSFSQQEGSANPGGLPFRYLIKGVMLLGFALLFLQALYALMALFEKKRETV